MKTKTEETAIPATPVTVQISGRHCIYCVRAHEPAGVAISCDWSQR